MSYVQKHMFFHFFDKFNSVIMPPFKKRGHIVLNLLVGLSVDQVMSAQYLSTPLLKNCQTSYNGCP